MVAGDLRAQQAAAGGVDPLAAYRRKRDFARTGEPAGGAPPGAGRPGEGRLFVVQRHRARRLHYDLRLEIGGVLASWAVPKGPTLDPGARRAAFQVEDHPLEYFDFEGVIPAGEYGGGDVIVWDLGTWEPAGRSAGEDPAEAVAAGELHLDLHGDKLRGRFVLVRSRTGDRGKQTWLLLHKHDGDAVAGWDPEDHPRSVLSGRTNDEVRAAPDAAELRALDRLGDAGVWEVFGRELRVTNLDKVLFPGRPGEDPLTKRDLLRWAALVAPYAVPHLAGRPFNMHRFPDGAAAPGFWHQALPAHAPGWLARWDDPDAGPGQRRTHLVIDQPAALLWAANFGALEWHAWTSTAARPESPTHALIDLDPGEVTTWDDLLVLARLHRRALEHLGVRAAAKVTGRRGIQIWIPIAPGPGFGETRQWVERLSRAVGAVVPELVSWKWQVDERQGLARLDYTQNARHKTLVAPYSPRPAAGAPVSMPIDWEELDDPALRPDRWTIRSGAARLAERGDLFAGALIHDQTLPPLA